MMPLIQLAPAGVLRGVGWVFAFLATSSAVAMAIPKVRRSESMRNAILGWWPVSVVGVLAVLCGRLASVVVLSIVSAGVLRESLALLRLPARFQRIAWPAGVLLAALTHALMLYDGALATRVAFLAPLVVMPVVYLLTVGSEDFVRSAGGAVWATLASVGMFSFAARLTTGDVGGPYGGVGAAFAFFVLVMMSDAMQFMTGKVAGRTPLIPSVSPKKTWEGFILGACATGLVGALVAPSVLHQGRALGFALGASVAVLGLAGDLIASGWKRDAGVKDSGVVIPGQGGLLDRCDSVLFVAPWFYGFAVACL